MNNLKDINPASPKETRPRVLIIEDEPGMVDFIEMGLSYEGFEATSVNNGLEGLEMALSQPVDLILLDLMLPLLDGIEVCRKVRQVSPVPIIILTARDELDDRVLGLDAGADDYITKPFQFKELVARMRAVLRRQTLLNPKPGANPALNEGANAPGVLTVADLKLDVNTREFLRGSRSIELSMREFELLKRQTILDRVWGFDFIGDANIIEVYVRYLRNKIGEPNLIQTVRGVGYVLRNQPRPKEREENGGD
jgi:two-component system response regulator MprA